MGRRAKLVGHAIHPMLIVFPLGLLAGAVIFDVVYQLTGNAGFATAAFWNIAAGIIGGLLAAVFGLVDWLAIPGGTRAKAIASDTASATSSWSRCSGSLGYCAGAIRPTCPVPCLSSWS